MIRRPGLEAPVHPFGQRGGSYQALLHGLEVCGLAAVDVVVVEVRRGDRMPLEPHSVLALSLGRERRRGCGSLLVHAAEALWRQGGIGCQHDPIHSDPRSARRQRHLVRAGLQSIRLAKPSPAEGLLRRRDAAQGRAVHRRREPSLPTRPSPHVPGGGLRRREADRQRSGRLQLAEQDAV